MPALLISHVVVQMFWRARTSPTERTAELLVARLGAVCVVCVSPTPPAPRLPLAFAPPACFPPVSRKYSQ